MRNKDITFFRALFIISALWNLTGAVFGYFNTAYTFQAFFDQALTDPLYYTIYQGAWGTTLVYFIGYLFVAYDPFKHTGIVILGGIGKIGRYFIAQVSPIWPCRGHCVFGHNW